MYSNLLIIYKTKNKIFDDFNNIRFFKDDTYVVFLNNDDSNEDKNNVIKTIKDKFQDNFNNVGIMLYGFENSSKIEIDIDFLKQIKTLMKSSRIDLFNCVLDYRMQKKIQSLIPLIDNTNRIFFACGNKDGFKLNTIINNNSINSVYDIYTDEIDCKQLYFQLKLVNMIKFDEISFDNKPLGLLIVASNVENIDYLLDCINNNILIFKYDIEISLEEFYFKLFNFLREAENNNLEKNSLELFGIIGHNYDVFKICKDAQIDHYNYKNIEQCQFLINIIEYVKQYLKSPARLDLMACKLGNDKNFQKIFNIIETITDIKIAFSTDNTGNDIDSNWMLEKYDINLLTTYFIPETNMKLRESKIIIKLINFNSLTIVSNDPSATFTDLGNQLINNNSNLGFLAKGLVDLFNIYFAGKSLLEIISSINDIIGFIPGPIGFISGLVGAGLSIAIYQQKLANGQVSELDTLDMVMGCIGSVFSVIPGAKAGAKLATNAVKIASKSATRITTKVVNGLSIGYVGLSVSHITVISQTLDILKQSLGASNKYKNAINYISSYGRDVAKKYVPNYVKIVDIYNQIATIESIIGNATGGYSIDTDANISLSPSRQCLIDCIVALSNNLASNPDILCGRDSNSVNVDYGTILGLFYGTLSINSDNINWDNTVSIDKLNKGIFIDNETKIYTGTITTITLNPMSAVILKNKLGIQLFQAYNNDYNTTKYLTLNLPYDSYNISCSTYSSQMINLFENLNPGSIKLYNNNNCIAIVNIGDYNGLDQINILNNPIGLYGRGCIKTTSFLATSMSISPNTNVVLLTNEPNSIYQNDDPNSVICAWSNNTSDNMTINLKDILTNFGNPTNIYLGISLINNNVYKYGKTVRLMYQDTTSRMINVSEIMVKKSGFYIEGGQLKFNRLQHKLNFNPTSINFSSVYIYGSNYINDSNIDTYGQTSQSVMPWIDIKLDNNYNKYIDSFHLINRKDACQDRIIGARFAVFDTHRYLTWMSDPITQVSLEYDLPILGGLRFNLVKITSQVKSQFITWINFTDVLNNAFGFFTNPSVSINYNRDIIFNNYTGVAYLELPTYFNIPLLYRKLCFWSNNDLTGSLIDLSIIKDKNNQSDPTNYTTVFQSNRVLSNKSVINSIFGNNYYEIDLWKK